MNGMYAWEGGDILLMVRGNRCLLSLRRASIWRMPLAIYKRWNDSTLEVWLLATLLPRALFSPNVLERIPSPPGCVPNQALTLLGHNICLRPLSRHLKAASAALGSTRWSG